MVDSFTKLMGSNRIIVYLSFKDSENLNYAKLDKITAKNKLLSSEAFKTLSNILVGYSASTSGLDSVMFTGLNSRHLKYLILRDETTYTFDTNGSLPNFYSRLLSPQNFFKLASICNNFATAQQSEHSMISSEIWSLILEYVSIFDIKISELPDSINGHLALENLAISTEEGTESIYAVG